MVEGGELGAVQGVRREIMMLSNKADPTTTQTNRQNEEIPDVPLVRTG